MRIKTIYFLLINLSLIQCMPAKKYATVNNDFFIEKKENKDTTTFGDRVISSTLKFSILDKENNQNIIFPIILINKVPIQVDSENKTKLFSGNYRFEIIAVGFQKKKWNMKTNNKYNYNIILRMDRNITPLE